MRCMNTGMIWQTSSTGSDDTERLGESLGRLLVGGEVIELRSDLGGGKTTFVRGLARGAGSKDNVTSPTFTLNRLYRSKDFNISHFDFYRLDEPGIMSEQLAESLDSGDVVVVEWGEVVKHVLPDNRLAIEFLQTEASADERAIRFCYPINMSPLIMKLQTDWQESRP